MASHPSSSVSDRPLGWPAWSVSLAVHILLLVTMVVLLRDHKVRGAADEPGREVGIVLKRMTDDGPQFDGEQEDSDSETVESTRDTRAHLQTEALPDASELPESQSALPNTPAIGISALEQGKVGDATALASGAAPSKHIGGKARVRLFGVEGVGTKFVYVFDRSISMEGAPLRAAKRQLIASLESLESVHQFQIIFFNHKPKAWDLTGGQKRVAFATDRNKNLAEKFIRSITATGGTYRHTALRQALAMNADVIFFLTDADDPMGSADVAKAVRRASRSGTGIHTIEFGIGPATVRENFLIRLARESGGQYVYVDTTRLEARRQP